MCQVLYCSRNIAPMIKKKYLRNLFKRPTFSVLSGMVANYLKKNIWISFLDLSVFLIFLYLLICLFKHVMYLGHNVQMCISPENSDSIIYLFFFLMWWFLGVKLVFNTKKNILYVFNAYPVFYHVMWERGICETVLKEFCWC